MDGPPSPAIDDLEWSEGGPRSRRFADVYFSTVDGLAEARAVFLQGCRLPDAWAGRRSFVVGELGFGSGLNLLALLDLWRKARPPSAQLHLFSVEAFPLSRVDAARALGAWPELDELASMLLEAWPEPRLGFHRLDLPGLDARLDLWIGEAADGLRAWSGRADAWFLDGFAPARNPEMWRPEVLALVAARSAPGARLASFTVAGAVRRGLEAVGFTVDRQPGFGRKRQRLEAQAPDTSAAEPTDPPLPRVAVIGAGIAGAALARAFSALGCAPLLFEAERPGAGGSGNPAALVTPRLDAGLGPVARLHVQAFARAGVLYRRDCPVALIAKGALQLECEPRDSSRFDRIANWDGFAPGALQRIDAAETAKRLGERTASAAFAFRDALTLEPTRVLETWLAGAAAVRAAKVARLEPASAGWRLIDTEGQVLTEAEAVVLAAGPWTGQLLAGVGVETRLRAVRGQVSWADLTGPPESEAAAWGGYAIPLPRRAGWLFGATHQRDDWDVAARPEDDGQNLQRLDGGRPSLAARLSGRALQHRASLRAATPDHLPLAGFLKGRPGLHVLAGLGGRGFTLAPLLAEHVAAGVLGVPSPLAVDLAILVDPGRFAAPPPRPGARTQAAAER